MSDKLESYSDIINRLAEETVACSPETWALGTLFMQCDGERLTYQLRSEASAERASISELLRDLIDELYSRMHANGEGWTSAELSWAWRNDEEVSISTKLAYPTE